jgi:putative PIN family toxin of toxin-antitoxin system
MTSERVVFETATLICGLLSAESPHAHAIERAVARGQIVVTPTTLKELMATMLSPKLDPYVSCERRDALLFRLAPFVEIVAVVQRVRGSGDLKWDRVLEAAANGRADVIVSDRANFVGRTPLGALAVLRPDEYVNWRDSQSPPAVVGG